jgi:hypothetical protein
MAPRDAAAIQRPPGATASERSPVSDVPGTVVPSVREHVLWLGDDERALSLQADDVVQVGARLHKCARIEECD